MERIIFTDDVCKYVDMNRDYIIESIQELLDDYEDNDFSDESIYEEAYRLIEFDCDYMRDCAKYYDKKHYCNILVVGSFGLWYGRRDGGKVFGSLEEALSDTYEDYNTLYYERKNGTLKLTAVHHDGRNEFTFYRITPQGDKFIRDNCNMDARELHEALIKRGYVKNIRRDEVSC